MKKNVVFKNIVCTLTFLSANALAENASLQIPNQIINARPASLGGAFTAVADDQNALYFNPAGLAFIDETFMAILDSDAALSLGSGGLGAAIDDVKSAIDLGRKVTSAKGISDQIDAGLELGKLMSSRTGYVGLRTNHYFAQKRWGIALSLQSGIGTGIHSNILPEIADIGVSVDADLRGAYAHPFLDGRVSLGVAPFIRTRGQIGAANLSISDVSNKDSEYLKPKLGTGLGLDFGLMVRPFKVWSPTFGLAIVNVGDTHLKASEDSFISKFEAFKGSEVASPQPLRQLVNAGFSITPIDGRGFVRVSGELREINRPTPAELKPAGSVEAGFRSSIVRATGALGWGNGGWSAGVEARAFLKLRLATYIEPNLLFARKENQRVWVFSFGI